MADPKLQISWEEISSPEVDRRVQQQELSNRAQERNAAQQGSEPVYTPAAGVSHSSVLNNTLVYMTLFGAVGGLFAWAAAEVRYSLLPTRPEVFLSAWNEAALIEGAAQRGEISTEEARRRTAGLEERYRDNPYVRTMIDPTLTEAAKRERMDELVKFDFWDMLIRQVIMYALVGLFISFFLSIADHVVSRNVRGMMVYGTAGIIIGALGGAVMGIAIDRIYQAMGGGIAGGSTQVIARTVGWTLLGLCLAAAPGLVLRNGKRLAIGLAGGALGGFVGGLAFDVIGLVSDSGLISRLIGHTAIGLVAGAGTGLIEMAAKTGWLRILSGPIAGKQFVIYKEPTFIGSSPQCEIYLFKDPRIAPRHAAIHRVPGGFEIEDSSGTSGTIVNGRAISRVRLRNDDEIQISGTTLRFQERQRT